MRPSATHLDQPPAGANPTLGSLPVIPTASSANHSCSTFEQQVDHLTTINLRDILASLGLGQARRGRNLLEWPWRRPARRFARQIATFDRVVGERGLRAGAAWALARLVGRLEVAGLEHLPEHGPLLVVANHPGLSDTLALFATLPRPDLLVIARDVDFLAALPEVSRYLVYLPDGEGVHLAASRRIVGHLRRGGALLAFPGGQIEPDPAVLPGAASALEGWSPSIGSLVRLAPDVRLVPALVSGVLSAAAQRNPITRLRRDPRDRAWLGAMLQIAIPAYQAVNVRLAFGPSLAGRDLLTVDPNAGGITRQLTDRVRLLIDSPPADWHPVINS